MRNLVYILFLVAIQILMGCETGLPVDQNDQKVAVSFSIENGLAGSGSIELEAIKDSVDYALVMISSTEMTHNYYLSLSDSTGVWRTEELLLEEGTYSIEEFILFREAGAIESRKDDQMIAASAHDDSEYGKLTDNTLSKDFSLSGGIREDIPITVFWNDPLKDFYWWYWYGFVEFQPSIVYVKEALFYGDFCSDEFLTYAESKYGSYPKIDMPAIFRIDIFADQNGDGNYDTHILSKNNEKNYSNAEEASYVDPLSINLVDTPEATDYYRLDVYVYELTGINASTGEKVFDYKYFDSWYCEDEADILYGDASYRVNPQQAESFGAGQDGIFDFIVGPCTVIDWDIDLNDPDFGDEVNNETAYARAESGAVCFLESGFSRWGWTNQLLNELGKNYELSIWAGAGQCDTSKGQQVGTLSVEIGQENQAIITYQLNEGYSLEETHLYTGSTPFPVFDGNYTVASGLFPSKHEIPDGNQSDHYSVTLPDGRFFLIAHAVIKK